MALSKSGYEKEVRVKICNAEILKEKTNAFNEVQLYSHYH